MRVASDCKSVQNQTWLIYDDKGRGHFYYLSDVYKIHQLVYV